VVRTPDDLFRSDVFPNYHYVKLVLDGDTLRGTMIRLDPLAASSAWSVMDHFEIAVGK